MRALSWQHNWQTITRKLRVVSDVDDEQALIDALSRPDVTTVLGFANAHAMNLVAANTDYFNALLAADVLLRDGSGMAILFRRLGLEPGLNMNGTDFIPKLLAAFKGRRVAFWGTEEPFLANAVQRSEAHICGQCSLCSPWFRAGGYLHQPCPAVSAGTGCVGYGHAQARSRCRQVSRQWRALSGRVRRGDSGFSRRQGHSCSAMGASSRL